MSDEASSLRVGTRAIGPLTNASWRKVSSSNKSYRVAILYLRRRPVETGLYYIQVSKQPLSNDEGLSFLLPFYMDPCRSTQDIPTRCWHAMHLQNASHAVVVEQKEACGQKHLEGLYPMLCLSLRSRSCWGSAPAGPQQFLFFYSLVI